MTDTIHKSISEISQSLKIPDPVQNVFLSVYDFVSQNRYEGACHETSAIMHVLLRELDVKSSLKCGELTSGIHRFDHSWIEVEDRIYDISIAYPLSRQHASPPIFASIDTISRGNSKWSYGKPSIGDDDDGMKMIKRLGFVQYLNGSPIHKNGTWHLIQKLGNRLGLKINLNEIKNKHIGTAWDS